MPSSWPGATGRIETADPQINSPSLSHLYKQVHLTYSTQVTYVRGSHHGLHR
jgi:hypothetical protein